MWASLAAVDYIYGSYVYFYVSVCYNYHTDNYNIGDNMATCKCGCGEEVIQHNSRRTAVYIWLHHTRGQSHAWAMRPKSTNKRTLRWRARSLIPVDVCAMQHIGGCSERIQVHHIDKNVENNKLSNLVAVCVSHHRLLDLGRITLQSTKMPEFYIDTSGKRRYKKEST